MEKKVFAVLFLYFCVLSNHQLQSMESNALSERTFNRVWQQIAGGEVKENEVKRFLESNVLSISYSDAPTQKKVELLNNFFIQAFNAHAINNPFKKQFCGIGFTFHDN